MTEDYIKSNWDNIYLPATMMALSRTEVEEMSDNLREAISGQVSMMLCIKFNGNDISKLRTCAIKVSERMNNHSNREFFKKCATSSMPDSTLRIRVREMKAADNKAERQMRRNGDL